MYSVYHEVFYLKFTLKYNFALLGNVAHRKSLVSPRIIIQKKDQLYKNSLKFIKIPLMQLALLLTVSKIELVNPFRITILVVLLFSVGLKIPESMLYGFSSASRWNDISTDDSAEFHRILLLISLPWSSIFPIKYHEAYIKLLMCRTLRKQLIAYG